MSKNEKDILTQKFRERLENYEFPVSSDVWESIEKDLSSLKKPAVRLMWRQMTAVAATMLLLLGMGWYFAAVHWDSEEKTGYTVSGDWGHVESLELPDHKQTTFHPAISAKSDEKQTSFNREIAVQARNDAEQRGDDAERGNNNVEQGHDDIKQGSNDIRQARNDNILPDLQTPVRPTHTSRRKSRRPFTLALAYGNQGNSPASPQEMREWYPSVFSTVNRVRYDALPDNFSTTEVHHDMPVTVSMSVRKYFTPNWAYESGLTYTCLKSTETQRFPNGNVFSKDIRLHYLGVPLKIVYSFYVNNRLSLYTSAGGTVEKCVSGLDIPELQYSLNGNVGLNYKLFGAFGLFVEPGVGYYFDDHNSIRTIRKDKPWNVGIQMGFRLSY